MFGAPVGVEIVNHTSKISQGCAGGVGVAAVGNHLHLRGFPGQQISLEILVDPYDEERAAAVNPRGNVLGSLEIGLALATEPKLLLLDEPAAGMSPTETLETVALIRQLRSSVTIVIVEHDMDVVFGLADRIMVLQNGVTIAYGTPDEIRADARVRDAYLGGADDE